MSTSNVNIKNFIKNSFSNSTNEGKCGNISDDLKYSKTNPTPPESQTQLFDYYVCGENNSDAPDHHGYCKGLTHSEWTSIWANCRDDPSEDNYDKCSNMVTTSSYREAADKTRYQDSAGCDMRTHTDGTTYDPVTGVWSGEGAAAPIAGTGCKCDFCAQAGGCDAGALIGDLLYQSVTLSQGGICSPNTPGLQGTNKDFKGFDHWSWDWMRDNNNIRPAYPVNNQPLDSIGNKPDNQDHALETAEDIPPHDCPTGYREFTCAGDGSSDDNGDLIPGCGTGREWNDNCGNNCDYNGHQDSIKFCARPNNQYDVVDQDIGGLMGCCLGKGNIDELSNRECPTGYCVTNVNYTDALESLRCDEPVGSDLFNQTCYEMTNQCNELFKEQCTQRVFTRTSSPKKTACIKWSKIQKEEFNTIAENICSVGSVVFGSDYDGSQTNQEIIDEILTNAQINVPKVANIFKSDICRDWLTESGDSKLLLNELCSRGSQPNADGTFKVNSTNDPIDARGFYNDLIDVCHCYWSEDYYRWYKDNVLSEEERNTIGQNVRPECFHRRCMLSGTYSTEDNTECPSIINCKNEINTHILNMDGSLSEDAVDSIESSLANNQACNINSVNQDYTPPSTGQQGTTTSSSNNVTDSSTGQGAQQSGTGSDGETYTGSDQRNPDGSSSNDPKDNTLLIVGLVGGGILLFLLLVILLSGRS